MPFRMAEADILHRHNQDRKDLHQGHSLAIGIHSHQAVCLDRIHNRQEEVRLRVGSLLRKEGQVGRLKVEGQTLGMRH